MRISAKLTDASSTRGIPRRGSRTSRGDASGSYILAKQSSSAGNLTERMPLYEGGGGGGGGGGGASKQVSIETDVLQHIRSHTRARTHIHTRTHTQARTHTHTHTQYTYSHAYAHVCIGDKCMHSCTRVPARTHSSDQHPNEYRRRGMRQCVQCHVPCHHPFVSTVVRLVNAYIHKQCKYSYIHSMNT